MFFCSFSYVFVDFGREIRALEITQKALKWTKKVENGWKKCFDQLSGAASTLKLVEIHNKWCTEEIVLTNRVKFIKLLRYRSHNSYL